jgi:hypothetical protein
MLAAGPACLPRMTLFQPKESPLPNETKDEDPPHEWLEGAAAWILQHDLERRGS